MNKLFLIPLFLLGLLFTGCSSDEDVLVGNINGIITNHITGEPIRNASVILSPSNRTTVTGNDGHYEFTEVDPGQYKIQVSASGYTTNSRQVTVTAGKSVSGDMTLTPIEKKDAIELSTRHLHFGTELNEMALDINNVGNSGTISWNISGIDVSWLSVSPISGKVEMGKSESIKVKINRASINKEETTHFTVNAAGGSISVMVTVGAIKVGDIYGIISDIDTGEPIKNAFVTLSPSNNTAITSEDGHYEFKGLEPGKYNIHVSATDYNTDTREITVVANEKANGDLPLRHAEKKSGIKLSASHLNFGTNLDELVLDIENIGNSGVISWNISGLDVPWLTVSPNSGNLQMGKTTSIKVKVDRKTITKEETTFFMVNAAGNSNSVMVSVSPAGGNTPDNPDEPTEEDYSSADIIMNNSSVSAKIISCKRYGSTIEFYYLLENHDLDDADQFRILTPFNNMSGTKTTIFYDNLNMGNEYNNIDMTFRGKGMSRSQAPCVQDKFPIGIPCKCSVVLKDVDSKVKEMNFVIAMFNYMGTKYNEDIEFLNVPIY